MATKQAEKSAATRNKILEAGRKLFIEKGYEETTVEDIVTEAGFAVGTFYKHFETKTALAKHLYCEISNSSAYTDQTFIYMTCTTVFEVLDYLLDSFSEETEKNKEIIQLYTVLLYSKVNHVTPESVQLYSETILHYLKLQIPQCQDYILKTYSDILISLLNAYWMSRANPSLMPMDKAIIKDTLHTIVNTCILKSGNL